jgi:hypothetical protein
MRRQTLAIALSAALVIPGAVLAQTQDRTQPRQQDTQDRYDPQRRAGQTDTQQQFGTQQPYGTQQQRAGAQQQQRIDLEAADVRVTAPPSRVTVDQQAAQIDVEQQPAEVNVQMQAPKVLVEVPEPQVSVNQPPARVSVSQADPIVTVNQRDPIVRIQQQEPRISVQQADPEVEVRQSGEPIVHTQQAPAEVNVVSADPIVSTERAQPQVQVRQDQMQDGRATQRADAPRGALAAMPESLERREFNASELQGMEVIDLLGRRIGTVDEVWRDTRTDATFVLVDVQADRNLQITSQRLLLDTNRLERNSGRLLTRLERDRLNAAGNFEQARYTPARNARVELAVADDE